MATVFVASSLTYQLVEEELYAHVFTPDLADPETFFGLPKKTLFLKSGSPAGLLRQAPRRTSRLARGKPPRARRRSPTRSSLPQNPPTARPPRCRKRRSSWRRSSTQASSLNSRRSLATTRPWTWTPARLLPWGKTGPIRTSWPGTTTWAECSCSGPTPRPAFWPFPKPMR